MAAGCRISPKFKGDAEIGVILTELAHDIFRDTLQCNVARSGVNGNIYLCCATPSAVILLQWYEPLAKFLILKSVEIRVPHFPILPFQLIYSAGSDADFPKVLF